MMVFGHRLRAGQRRLWRLEGCCGNRRFIQADERSCAQPLLCKEPVVPPFSRRRSTLPGLFVTASPDDDLSMVVRPRTHPLLTPFETSEGVRHVWTTFSADQVDLNFANPAVMLEMIRILLFHIEKGIQVIRLDAIAYLWKEIGHPSIHHPKTHAAVKLFVRFLMLPLPGWLS